ncbi:hypothetical protein Taro_037514 [Colocasia esculenta]|uniref:Outer envelope protein 61 n=1 Tax=Colocasia esculenta TaxID=4460 RepID=A0A843WJG5_COLES|nr:hypothetical protein [Colocasia esculenta]
MSGFGTELVYTLQMLSNPELMKLASESMKNLRPEDMRSAAEQLKHTRVEDMVDIGEKMTKATPEELAAIHAQADAQISYKLSAAEMLKKQGNEFHSCGKFHDAAQKYMLAKDNLNDLPAFKCRTLQLQCSLNLMSCYLKTGQFEECIKEGSDVLSYDSKNVKALYRRGQAYKEFGRFEVGLAAVSDLKKAHEVSPDDETIADVLRDVNERLGRVGNRTVSGGLVIEELVEEVDGSVVLERSQGSSHAKYSVSPPQESNERSQSKNASDSGKSMADSDHLQGLRENPEAVRLFQNYFSGAGPTSLAAGDGKMSPEMIKTATEMISTMKPDELQRMLQVASSMNGNGSGLGSHLPEMSPEMVQMASDRISKMSPEELQSMVDVASSLNPSFSPSPVANSDENKRKSKDHSRPSEASAKLATENSHREESSSSGVFSTSTVGSSSSGLPNASADLQENMKNAMKDPAMRQMFASMMKNMSPEMMTNMSEQFGMKLSKEEAAKAQQAMSSLSMDDLDRMMRWAERAQKGVDTVKKTKNWLLGTPGLILAICMLILAFIFHQLGWIGG